MATAVAAAKGPKELTFTWEGKDKGGKVVRGELRAVSEAAVNATLRRQGILVQKVKPLKRKGGGKVASTLAGAVATRSTAQASIETRAKPERFMAGPPEAGSTSRGA